MTPIPPQPKLLDWPDGLPWPPPAGMFPVRLLMATESLHVHEPLYALSPLVPAEGDRLHFLGTTWVAEHATSGPTHGVYRSPDGAAVVIPELRGRPPLTGDDA